MENYYPSLSDGSSDVLSGLKRSLNNNGPRLTNSPNVSTLSTAANTTNLTRLFQQYPPSSLSIPSIYQNPNLFTSTNPNISNINLNSLTGGNKSLPIDRQDYLDSLNAATRDNISSSLNSNAHQLNHRRRPSLLQSAAYSAEFGGLQSQYIPYLSEPFRENLNRNLLARNKTLLPQHYQSLNAATNSSLNQTLLNTPFNPHLNLAQSTPPLNFLQSNQATYSDNNDSNKRPRLSSIQPLLIDTVEIKKEPAYTVQVEAISPTPNEDTLADASPIKTTKDDILQQINQIDREITQTENQMSKLKRKQQEIKASNKTGKSSDLNEYLESKQQSITQVIYFENRKKANDSQRLLENLGPKVILPIYNQPSDTKIYHENKEKFVKFKELLQQHFKRKLRRKQERQKYLTDTYDKMMQEWLHKLESKDLNPNKKSKDNKLREFFEKQFPELKKAREDKERLSRAGQRVRSDADLEDIMDGIQEQELEDKKIRAYAVIPPILYDIKERTYRFITNNCKIDDPVREHKELTYLNVWTDVEKEIFKEKFLQAPKNFGLISSYLENKTVMDCVQYYYSSKKRENYKQLLRKNAKKRTRALAKAQQQAAQQQAQQIQRNLARNKQLEIEKENQMKAATTIDNKLMLVDMAVKDEKTIKTPPIIIPAIKEEQQQTENDEDCLQCVKCLKKIDSNSKFYVINRINCFLYSLSIEDVKGNSALCKQCKKEFGTGECPVPSCRAVKKSNRRLKTLPREWFELTPENRYTFSAELNFPLDCKRCCTRCYIRLIRKYSSAFITNYKSLTMKKYLNCIWDDSEIEKLKNAIRKNGRDWDVISSTQVVTKSAKQCRQFYFYFKYNLNLDELMKMTTFQTDDFDSDSCWKEIASDNDSSEDEYLIERKIVNQNLEKLQDFKKLNSSQINVKSDCDSNSLMIIDESQTNISEIDNRSTLSSKLSSHHIALTSSYNSDKSRPTSSDNLDIDSKLKLSSNQKYSQQKQRFSPAPIKSPAQMPSFVKYLIDPNAPTTSNNQNKLSSTTPRQDSPTIQTSMNTQSANVNLPSTQLNSQSLGQPGQVFTTNSNQQQSQQLSKDKATCVRDLIYHTIDITYQADKSSNKSPLDQQQTKDQVKSVPINPTGLPLYFPSEKLVSTTNQLQQIITPYNLNLSPLVSLPINATTGNLNEIENEVQDLSKKSSKKESDYLQPKNYSISKSKATEFINLSNVTPTFNPNSMPPPAHLSSINSSLNNNGRTSTPVLDEQQHLQNFYLNNLQNAARHTDSPRSRGLTPNHLSSSSSTSSQSPTPSSNRSSSSNKLNQSKNTNIAPPPLITNNLINNQQYSITNQSTANVKGSITQGTPVHLNQQHQQYLMNKEREAAIGSITLGTPLYRSNSRSNMPKLTPTSNFLSSQSTSAFNLPSTLPSTFPNVASSIINQNFSKESQLSSTQNQIMIDFNTSKQMQKRSANLSDTKERNSPLSLNRLTAQYPPTIPGYPTLAINFNPLFASTEAQKTALELTKSQSPLITESTKANSPKMSPSPNARNQNSIYGQAPNFLSQQQSSQMKNQSSVIQTSSSLQQPLTSQGRKTPSNALPLYSQAHDAFQTNLLTLVNTAATQKRIEHIENLTMSVENKKSNESSQFKDDDRSTFLNQSSLKFNRNPFTQEQFDKEMKNQELMKIQKQQQQLIDEHQAAIKNERNKLTKFDLDNHASRIFCDSFQKDTATTSSSSMLRAESLIDAIICHQINQPDINRSQKDKINSNNMPYTTVAGNNFLTDHRLKNYLNDLTTSNQSSLTTQSINPLHFLHDRKLSNLTPISSGNKLSDDILNESQNWKLRKALEPKDSQRKDNSSTINKTESHIEIEPISPPSSNTPTKDQSFSNLPTSATNDPVAFEQFFHSKIAQAMNIEQSDKDIIPKKKVKLDDEIQSGELDVKKELNKMGLESISSLSELKTQKAEFQKQLKLSSDGDNVN